MPYNITKSDGTNLTTISDGSIDTTSTSLALPGRNYAGYGQSIVTNFVRLTENFADDTPPANPIAGQTWYDVTESTLKVCPVDGESNAAAWLSLTATSSGGNTSFGAINVSGNISANNAAVTNSITANLSTISYLSVDSSANISSANITTANLGTTRTTVITTGAATTTGTMTGVWTVNGSAGGAGANAMVFNTGGIYINPTGNLYGVRTDKYMWANGDPVSFAGTYSNANVAAYLPAYGGNILTVKTQTVNLTTGANTTSGTITGNWTLTTGSRLQATYADLAERFESDAVYEAGTVVKIGGDKEVTIVTDDLSDDVFGVISDTAAYLMNSTAGTNATHPPVALAGRVTVKVTGLVNKGDRLVSAGDGKARSASRHEVSAFNVIGRALKTKTSSGDGTIEAIVLINK